MVCKESDSSEKEKDICLIYGLRVTIRSGVYTIEHRDECAMGWDVGSQRYILFLAGKASPES